MERSRSAVEMDARARGTRVTAERRVFRDLFVARLRRIHERRTMYGSELTTEARYLIDRAMYSTYWDCVRLGLRDEARQVLGLPAD